MAAFWRQPDAVATIRWPVAVWRRRHPDQRGRAPASWLSSR